MTRDPPGSPFWQFNQQLTADRRQLTALSRLMQPVSHACGVADGDRAAERCLLEDTAYLEARPEQMGHLGDCAYEKAMTRTYAVLVRERRLSLAHLRSARATGEAAG